MAQSTFNIRRKPQTNENTESQRTIHQRQVSTSFVEKPVKSVFATNYSDDSRHFNVYLDLLNRLFNSITIHGFYFLGESRTIVGKFLWLLVVVTGISGATFVIFDSYQSWKLHPVFTTGQV